MGPATCRAGLGAEWIVTWMLASGPAGSKAKQVAASVETRKHGWHLPHARWRLSHRQRRGRANWITRWLFYGTIAAGSIGTIFRHTESSSVSFIRVTVTWCGIGVCGLDVRMQTVWGLGKGAVARRRSVVSTLYSYSEAMTPSGRIEARSCRAGGGLRAPKRASAGRRGSRAKKHGGRPEEANKVDSVASIDPDIQACRRVHGTGKCGCW